MNFVFYDRLKHVLDRYVTLETLRKIFAVTAPLVMMKDTIVESCRQMIPSYVERIVHFDTETVTVTTKYVGRDKLYSTKRALYEMLDMPKSGYYMIRVWNNVSRRMESYILQADMLERALEIKNVYNIWAFHDFAIVLMLANFISYSNLCTSKIVGICVNGKDVTKTLKSFMLCINMPNNARPKLLYMLCRYLENEYINPSVATNSTCTIIDDEMDETHIKNANAYIHPLGFDGFTAHAVCCSDESEASEAEIAECAEDTESSKKIHPKLREKGTVGTVEIEELFETSSKKRD